jgi:hypothetical protein
MVTREGTMWNFTGTKVIHRDGSLLSDPWRDTTTLYVNIEQESEPQRKRVTPGSLRKVATATAGGKGISGILRIKPTDFARQVFFFFFFFSIFSQFFFSLQFLSQIFFKYYSDHIDSRDPAAFDDQGDRCGQHGFWRSGRQDGGVHVVFRRLARRRILWPPQFIARGREICDFLALRCRLVAHLGV